MTRVEGRSDELYEQGLRDLFRAHGNSNTMAYLIGTEIYTELEKVVDRFEDVTTRSAFSDRERLIKPLSLPS